MTDEHTRPPRPGSPLAEARPRQVQSDRDRADRAFLGALVDVLRSRAGPFRRTGTGPGSGHVRR
ncbi:hypothetical protein GCM10023222_58180 [Saccharopolyspora cebuensis]